MAAFEVSPEEATDPRVVAGVFTWNPVRDNLDLDEDNVYHFTTVKIANGVTVRIRADKTRKPTAYRLAGEREYGYRWCDRC